MQRLTPVNGPWTANRWGGISRAVFCAEMPPVSEPQPTIPGVTKGVRPKNIRSVVVSTLAELIRRTALGDIGPAALVSALRELADTIEGKGKGAEPVAPKNQEMLEAFNRIFAYWKKATGKTRSRPSKDKREKVYARMRSGITEAEIKKAIDGCVEDEWHAEKGKNDLPYICQNDTKIEEFIEKAGGMPDRPERVIPDALQERIVALEEKAMEALDRGDHETYEAVQKQVERLENGG